MPATSVLSRPLFRNSRKTHVQGALCLCVGQRLKLLQPSQRLGQVTGRYGCCPLHFGHKRLGFDVSFLQSGPWHSSSPSSSVKSCAWLAFKLALACTLCACAFPANGTVLHPLRVRVSGKRHGAAPSPRARFRQTARCCTLCACVFPANGTVLHGVCCVRLARLQASTRLHPLRVRVSGKRHGAAQGLLRAPRAPRAPRMRARRRPRVCVHLVAPAST